MSGPDIETLASRIVYQNRWMQVRENKTRLRDGTEGIYGFVEKGNFVIIAPICGGVVHLVEQFRYPIGRRQWEFPQGGWDIAAKPLDVAHGELLEEAGLIAGSMKEAGELYPLYGTVTQKYRIFLASDLRPGVPAREATEQDMITRAFPLAEFERMIVQGEIQDAGTVASFGLLRIKGMI